MESLSIQTSSIGAVWPPAPTSHGRIRGFYTEGVITSQREADVIADHVYTAVEEMDESESISRVSLRLVAELGSLARLTFDGLTNVEAVLPVAGTDLGVVYIGANHPTRHMDDSYAKMHLRLLAQATERQRHSSIRDAEMHVVEHAQADELTAAFAPLYEIFGYDASATHELLSNQVNTIAYATIGRQVVSTAMAERGTVTIEGYGDITLVEITEASTHPDHRGKGLYTLTSGWLIDQIVSMRRNDPRSATIVYGESNLAMPGVINAASANGRRFSHHDRDSLNILNETFGILPQNFRVEDGAETRTYNDFAVSYVPLERSSSCS